MGLNISIQALTHEEFKYYFHWVVPRYDNVVEPKDHWVTGASEGDPQDRYTIYEAYKLHDLHDYMKWKFELKHGYDNTVGTSLTNVINTLKKDIKRIRAGKPVKDLHIPEGYGLGFEGFPVNLSYQLEELLEKLKEVYRKQKSAVIIYYGN